MLHKSVLLRRVQIGPQGDGYGMEALRVQRAESTTRTALTP